MLVAEGGRRDFRFLSFFLFFSFFFSSCMSKKKVFLYSFDCISSVVLYP